ncbi:PH domain-containing protein [Brachybacterium paraconglomeratum]|uniref:PH domain-containing protein n=1 Tax=Brachybacterium paraconglomeratum TaxID=173362 RepID=UPI0021A37819|nr:PH domain-containing protein [Brachybacterium paraconglomeratum]MCT1910387.1 PH domain-containing protein [Brachybacterium paraconglomeratum]
MTAPGPDPESGAPRHRTHPITPLVTGWKVVVGIIAVLTAQNIAQLANEFTIRRALIGLGILLVVVLVAIVLSALSWWFTTYAVDEDGVSVHSGMISRSREYAPRARIESVSIERPLLARLLGLAKVRVEVAGGGESYLDIEYVSSARAEELRLGILEVAAGASAPRTSAAPAEAAPADGTSAEARAALAGGPTEGSSAAGGQDAGDAARDHGGRLEEVLYDGVTDGELIARIPTERLVRSLVRDLGFLTGIVMSVVGVVVAVLLALWQEGFSIAILVALAPTAIAVPKYVFGRIDSGWGFVSRFSERGLRMRRGLANTRTDNIAAGRIQRFDLRRPFLWRGPGWTAVSATVAGIDDDDENGATSVLPVGTHEELRQTLGRLSAPLGTDDDLATLEHLLTARARDLPGLRTPVRWYWIARRTEVSILLPGALVHRSGLVSRTLSIVPRERIQELRLEDGPLARRLGVLDLHVEGAGDSLLLENLRREDALALHAVLAADARTLRRYRDRESWPRPALAPVGAAAQAPGSDPASVPGSDPEQERPAAPAPDPCPDGRETR